MRLIDWLVDTANRFPAVNYLIQKLISSDRKIQRETINHLLADRLQPRAGEKLRLLDLGSGTGHYVPCYPDEAVVILSDMNLRNCKYLKKRWQAHCVNLDGSRLPFPEASLDLVICSAVFHHLDSDLARKVMEDVHRVLKADGQFILMDSYIPRKKGFWPWFFEWVERGEYLRSADELRRIVADHGGFVLEREIDDVTNYHFKQIYFKLVKRPAGFMTS